MSKLPVLQIGDLKIAPPIVQGGMGLRVSLGNLASAVADCGAVGTISAIIIEDSGHPLVMNERDLREEIRSARRRTNGVLAVNIMVALTNYERMARIVAEEGIDIIFSGAGLPMSLPKLVEGTATKICPIVSSARTAGILCRNWMNKFDRLPDAIVVEGPLAGGHLGYAPADLEPGGTPPRLEDLLAETLAVAGKYGAAAGRKIPVIAGGGVFDGKDIARLLKLGAAGVQMASRFVCTHECDVADAFKQAYVNATEEDITIIKSPVGMPGRALRNEFLERAKRGEVSFSCHYQCLRTCDPATSPYCIADALLNASQGNLDEGFVFAGANVPRIREIVSVKQLIDELVADAERAWDDDRPGTAAPAHPYPPLPNR